MEREKPVLVVVDADPSRSHRAAEGLRIAAGLSMYPGIRVTVLLGEHAARAWRTRSARRVDAEVWDRALADLVENRVPVLEEEPSGIAWQGVIRFAE